MKGLSCLAALLLAGAVACGSSSEGESTSRANAAGPTGGTSTTGDGSTSTTSNAGTMGGLSTGAIGIGIGGQPDPDDLTKTSKVDLLFAIDNSVSMGDKQRILAQTVPDLIGRMATPDCIDSSGGRVASEVGGTCPNGGKLEFVPVTDIHIAVISSSLGAAGTGEICADGGANYNPTQEDMARLLTRGTNGAVPTFQDLGILAWDPDNDYGGETNLANLTSNFADLVTGVGEQGCGFEAQQVGSASWRERGES